jgi:hypothetical protein
MIDLFPHGLARRDRPVTFVDVVHGGATFTELFELLRAWIDEDHRSWPVIRRKLRFVGATSRKKTSPNTYRWQQHAAWTRQLPSRAVVNVSLDAWVWSYFGDHQVKLTRSYRPDRWLAVRVRSPPSRSTTMLIAAVQVEDRNGCRAVCNAAGHTHSSSARICWT